MHLKCRYNFRDHSSQFGF